MEHDRALCWGSKRCECECSLCVALKGGDDDE